MVSRYFGVNQHGIIYQSTKRISPFYTGEPKEPARPSSSDHGSRIKRDHGIDGTRISRIGAVPGRAAGAGGVGAPMSW